MSDADTIATPRTSTRFGLLRIHHVQFAIPRGGEDQCRAFWAGVLGMRELAKPPVLAARGGCWFRGGHVEMGEFPGHDRCYSADPFGNRLEFLQPQGD